MPYNKTLFRTYISLLLLFGAFNYSVAQQLGHFEIHRGISPFLLGKVLNIQDSTSLLKEVGKLEFNGQTEYTYSYPVAINDPYMLGGISFRVIAVTTVSDTIIRIMISQIYTPSLFKDFEKKAKKDFRQLCQYFKEQWKSSGKKKKFLQSPDKRIISEGLQWHSDNVKMNLALYEDKSETKRLFDISITLERSGNY
ncbi:MAG: hypothetical protein J0M30_12460 [Chitinophagales bacterium]|nr:hypothetical protein [Chitinophagales bacterium]